MATRKKSADISKTKSAAPIKTTTGDVTETKMPKTRGYFSTVPHRIIVQLFAVILTKPSLGVSALPFVFGQRKDSDYLKEIRAVIYLAYHPLKPDQELLDLCYLLNKILKYFIETYSPSKTEKQELAVMIKNGFAEFNPVVKKILKNKHFPRVGLILITLTFQLDCLFWQESVSVFGMPESEKLRNVYEAQVLTCINYELQIFTDLWKTRFRLISSPRITTIVLEQNSSDNPTKDPLHSLAAEMVDTINGKTQIICIHKLTCRKSQLTFELENLKLYATLYRKEYVKTCFEELDSALYYPISGCMVWLNALESISFPNIKSVLGNTYLSTLSSMDCIKYSDFPSPAQHIAQKASQDDPHSKAWAKLIFGKSSMHIIMNKLESGPRAYASSYFFPKSRMTAVICLIDIKCGPKLSALYGRHVYGLVQVISASRLIKESLITNFSPSSAAAKTIYSVNAYYSSQYDSKSSPSKRS